jgi:hypothetical protein
MNRRKVRTVMGTGTNIRICVSMYCVVLFCTVLYCTVECYLFFLLLSHPPNTHTRSRSLHSLHPSLLMLSLPHFLPYATFTPFSHSHSPFLPPLSLSLSLSPSLRLTLTPSTSLFFSANPLTLVVAVEQCYKTSTPIRTGKHVLTVVQKGKKQVTKSSRGESSFYLFFFTDSY